MTFEALARLRSASRVAEELWVTVSAVSHRIRQLEDHLDLKLFARGDFTLTADGAAYLVHVRAGLASLQQMSGRGGARRRSRVRLAAPPTFCRQLLMPRLEGSRSVGPGRAGGARGDRGAGLGSRSARRVAAGGQSRGGGATLRRPSATEIPA